MTIQRDFTELFGAISDTDQHNGAQPLSLEGASLASVTLQWESGAAPVGTFKVQGTNVPEPTSDDHWSDLSPTLPISGNDGVATLSDGLAAYRWIRPSFVLASGNATFTAHTTIKGR